MIVSWFDCYVLGWFGLWVCCFGFGLFGFRLFGCYFVVSLGVIALGLICRFVV